MLNRLNMLSEKWGKPDKKQVYRGSFHPLRAMRGLVTRVRGTAAFFQLLAFSSWHLAILRNDSGQNVHSLQYAAKAGQELQKQICDPNTCTSVELIMAVLVFASSTVSHHIQISQVVIRFTNRCRLR
jgi:hypothetical protein